MSKERCQSVFNRLNSRCILAEGHSGRHTFPNALLKKENPSLWNTLQIAKYPYSKDYLLRLDLANRKMLDYSEPEAEVTADPEPTAPPEPAPEPDEPVELKKKKRKKKKPSKK